MRIWIIFFIVAIGTMISGFVYLTYKISCFSWLRQAAGERRIKAFFFSVLLTAIAAFVIYLTLNMVNLFAILAHLMIFWFLCDLGSFLYGKLTQRSVSADMVGYSALALTILVLGAGAFCAYHVFRTEYTITTAKKLDLGGKEQFRIAAFADSHVGTTFHWQGFADQIDKLNAEHPDVVVIAGDFIDDDTTLEDMEKSCKELSRLQTTYGVYYVFGNHDKGYYASKRGYSEADLVKHLKENQVTVLEDQAVNIVGNVWILGRQDKEVYERRTIFELMEQFSPEDYVIDLNHQPNDYINEWLAEVDMVISGHTHGGQIFPLNRMGEWLHMNDRTYGHERKGNTDFIVTSGISDWAVKFKTGCISEYLVIDIKN